MKSIAAVLVACCLMLLAGFAMAAPKLVVDQAVYDFGSVPQGEKVLHTFILSNIGDTLLAVNKVRSSCGCTAALLSSGDLQPGEQTELKASFDSARFRGQVAKTIYLYSNDPVSPVAQLKIKGDVLELFSLDPRQVNFGNVNPGQQVESTVSLTNRTGEALSIDTVETTMPELQARYETDLPAGETRQIVVTLEAKPGKARFSGYVILNIRGEKTYDLRLPVYASFR